MRSVDACASRFSAGYIARTERASIYAVAALQHGARARPGMSVAAGQEPRHGRDPTTHTPVSPKEHFLEHALAGDQHSEGGRDRCLMFDEKHLAVEGRDRLPWKKKSEEGTRETQTHGVPVLPSITTSFELLHLTIGRRQPQLEQGKYCGLFSFSPRATRNCSPSRRHAYPKYARVGVCCLCVDKGHDYKKIFFCSLHTFRQLQLQTISGLRTI